MAYGDIETGEKLLSTIINPKSEEFKEAWNAGKCHMLRLSGSLSELHSESEVVGLILKVIIETDIEHTAYEAFAKTDMRGEGWAWNFYIEDGVTPLARPYLDADRKIRIMSTAHWQVSDAGKYGKFLDATINDFVIFPLD